jgi:uncharacterized protein YodC (DUF2158 family)
MSHFTQISAEIRDLEALRVAVTRCGGEIVENAECRWYNGAQRKEIVIKLPGQYDAALERQADGSYRLTADWYQGHVSQYLGENGDNLLQLYAVEKAKVEGRRRGFTVTERQEGEDILVTLRDPEGGALKVWCHVGGRSTCQPDGIIGMDCMKFMELEKALGAVEEHRRTGDFYEKEEDGRVRLGHFFCG